MRAGLFILLLTSAAAAQPSAPADSLRTVLLEIREADQAPRAELVALVAAHGNAPRTRSSSHSRSGCASGTPSRSPG